MNGKRPAMRLAKANSGAAVSPIPDGTMPPVSAALSVDPGRGFCAMPGAEETCEEP